MKTRTTIATATALAILGMTPPAEAVFVDTFFGWNYVDSESYTYGQYYVPDTMTLLEISYLGASGTWDLVMPDGMGDYRGVYYDPYTWPPTDIDGVTTRYLPTQTVPIDWIPPGKLTPWGSVYGFPTIGITRVMTNFATVVPEGGQPYVVGLSDGILDAYELVNSYSDERGDIYDLGRTGNFYSPTLSAPDYVYGKAIFSAASFETVVPLPAAFWLFGSGLFGLAAIGRLPRFRFGNDSAAA
ncbi:VPLPA-CTERM sorting domain-containing protein [Thiohalobacter sp. IOR34]|uniref:VPLPA-CTERM sorting domain-containing protein n=1 Tax=Thiohalobacter sp. IOR34 TaxID=3057176 RepID=UPI0025AF3E1A|nr:VPLPA-CTERM sorting domain-containing protein [Thiohalobacter sp. IOR34]WJW76444.1 VPLPA-CTERM sorting domain-containing protein [Thiohalobacter sp. IOR34]